MQSVLQFILAHQGVFAGFGVALLDLVFALNDSWKSNGVAHWVYVQLQGLKAPKQ